MSDGNIVVSENVLEDGLGNVVRHWDKLLHHVILWFITVAVLIAYQDPEMVYDGQTW